MRPGRSATAARAAARLLPRFCCRRRRRGSNRFFELLLANPATSLDLGTEPRRLHRCGVRTARAPVPRSSGAARRCDCSVAVRFCCEMRCELAAARRSACEPFLASSLPSSRSIARRAFAVAQLVAHPRQPRHRVRHPGSSASDRRAQSLLLARCSATPRAHTERRRAAALRRAARAMARAVR